VLEDGVIPPVLELIDNPAGVLLNEPPGVPVMDGVTTVVDVLHSGLNA
jgi:hypothetical protein